MGKVRDEASGSKVTKPAPKTSALQNARQRVTPFFANLFQSTLYKPSQGWYARLWTGIAIAALLAVGLHRLWLYLDASTGGPAIRFGVPAAFAVLFGWFLFRVLHYPSFVDFLIATEAEMNKVSWTTKADLYRATTVVLTTVVLMSLFLFGVDVLWSQLLQWIGVLKTDGGGGFGSTG